MHVQSPCNVSLKSTVLEEHSSIYLHMVTRHRSGHVCMQYREELPGAFPVFVVDAARELATNKRRQLSDASARIEFSELSLAIDDIFTSEVDDAVRVEKLPEGGWRVLVHVADPTALIDEGSALNTTAMERYVHTALQTGCCGTI